MAETKAKKSVTKKVEEDIDSVVDFTDEDLEKRVTIRNIADWDLGIILQNEVGEKKLTRNGTLRLSRSEIMSQINNGNKSISGFDGKGTHACIYIEDAPTRRWLGFESAGCPQKIFTDDVAKKLFAMSQSEFEEKLPKYIATRAEGFALRDAVKRLKFNDFRKMRVIANRIGIPLEEFLSDEE